MNPTESPAFSTHEMGLKLLQHKSYNVYNAQNIARVKRDEQGSRDRERIAVENEKAFERSSRIQLLRARNSGRTNGLGSMEKPTECLASVESQMSPSGKRDKEQLEQSPQSPQLVETVPDFSAIPTKTWYTNPTGSNSSRAATQSVADPLDMIKHYEAQTENIERERSRRRRQRRKRHQKER